VSVRRVVVVGGGVTGLTAAYRILAAGHDASGAKLEVTVLEERARLGGNIVTERSGGFVIDGGPDSFVTLRPQAKALCEDLGLGDRLIPTTPRNRRVFVALHGGLVQMPEGLSLGVPTRVWPMVRTPLVSWVGKARMALDLVLPKGSADGDESIGHFVRRRLGDEAAAQLAEPILGGIYVGNVDALSLRATFPQLLEQEQKYGSLIRGAIAQMAARSLAAGKSKEAPSAFLSLLGGMGELIDTLASKIKKAGGTIRVGAPVAAIKAGPADTKSPRFLVQIAGEINETIEADDVIVCTPAYAAADAIDTLDRPLSALLRQTPYISSATVVVAYRRADVPHALDATGLVVPKSEKRRVLAATFISSKWAGRAPSDAVLMRVFVGGHRDPGALALGDDALIALAREELGAFVGVRVKPMLARVFRYERANAQPSIGHLGRVKRARALATTHPGLQFAGAAFDGVGIPDCVRQANDAAANVVG
jgi:protoporphyrinogen/coproporphyrinogen III oxidase